MYSKVYSIEGYWLRLAMVTAIICSVYSANAQKKSDTLNTVLVHTKQLPSNDEKLNDFAAGQKIQTIDSSVLQQYRLQNMAALLAERVPVFVKSYSFNGLATLSFRGSSAAQSQVLWQGVPIQNAALGVADISALPVMFVNKVNIVYGGSGALFGSGNVGGAMMLENDNPVFDSGFKQFSLSGAGGSYGQYSGGLKGALGGNRWYVAGNAFLQTAQNNYRYVTAAGDEKQMENGQLQSGAVMVNAAYKLSERSVIDVSVWAQQYDREIPPALFEVYSVKQQQDQSLRFVAGWEKKKNGGVAYAKVSLINDAFRYDDSSVRLSTSGSVFQYYQEVGIKKPLGRHGRGMVFVPVQLSWLPNAADSQRQRRVAIAGAYTLRVFANRLEVSAQGRVEQINSNSIFLPGAGVSFMFTNWLQLRANMQRTYRLPTLNELYYFPGGNARLLPEQGWSKDAGYTLTATKGGFSFTHDASVYDRNIDNWIMWLGGAIWTPHNIAKVHSRGFETDNKVDYKAGDWNLHLSAMTAYAIATTSSSYILNDGSIDKQIPYTPRYNFRFNAGFTWKRSSFNYNHTYTGYRFITTDESAWIKPYQTGNIHVLYNAIVYRRDVQLNVQCNNIWNERYSIAGFRPMPGINWLAGFRVSF